MIAVLITVILKMAAFDELILLLTSSHGHPGHFVENKRSGGHCES